MGRSVISPLKFHANTSPLDLVFKKDRCGSEPTGMIDINNTGQDHRRSSHASVAEWRGIGAVWRVAMSICRAIS